MVTQFFLGVDGGGTHTVAWLGGKEGVVLARAVAGPSNPLKVGFSAAKREIHQAIRRALLQAKVRRSRLQAVCVGLAGIDRPAAFQTTLEWLRKVFPSKLVLLTSDAALTLHTALGILPGVVVISGTGSIAYGRDQHGRLWRSGGWGSAFDDAGSAYDLGRKAIIAVLHEYDGRGPKTRLRRKICHAVGIREITDIVSRVPRPDEIAGLSPLVLKAARQRDAVARKLCEDASHDLAKLACAIINRLDWKNGDDLPVFCAGGLFRASTRMRQDFAQHLRRHAPSCKVSLLRRQPVEGALELARVLGNFQQDARCVTVE